MEVDGYKLIKNKHGNRYMKDNRFVKFDNVPQAVKDKLETHSAAAELDPKKCIFCGIYATETRFIQLQTIALCDEHFYSKNVGQIVQRLKEIYKDEGVQGQEAKEKAN